MLRLFSEIASSSLPGRTKPTPGCRRRSSSAFAVLIALGSILLIPGCSKPISGIDTGCLAYQILEPSRQDTQGTLDQIAAHNRVYRELCGAP